MSDFYLMTVLICNKMCLQNGSVVFFFSVVWQFLSLVVVILFLDYSEWSQNTTTVLKECFFFLEKLALFVQLVREGHKRITETIVKGSRMTSTEQYINIGIPNANQEDKTRQHKAKRS